MYTEKIFYWKIEWNRLGALFFCVIDRIIISFWQNCKSELLFAKYCIFFEVSIKITYSQLFSVANEIKNNSNFILPPSNNAAYLQSPMKESNGCGTHYIFNLLTSLPLFHTFFLLINSEDIAVSATLFLGRCWDKTASRKLPAMKVHCIKRLSGERPRKLQKGSEAINLNGHCQLHEELEIIILRDGLLSSLNHLSENRTLLKWEAL